tara:strand:- start:439 stop:678 length:240 start_codon:yes stop_codon:yes gene_type:complete
MTRTVLSLKSDEVHTLLLALEAAMLEATSKADTPSSQEWLHKLDGVWNKICHASQPTEEADSFSAAAAAYLDLMQCSEV